MEPNNISELPHAEVKSIVRVIKVIVAEETDTDHISSIMSDYADICSKYGDVVWPDDQDLTEDDVAVALDVFDAFGYNTLYEFVDFSASHADRSLPEPRNWEVVYKDSETKEILKQEQMEFSDAAPTTPIIDNIPYDCSWTEWDEQTYIIHVVEAEPEEDAYIFDCSSCDASETADTKAEAYHMVREHLAEYPDHSCSYTVTGESPRL